MLASKQGRAGKKKSKRGRSRTRKTVDEREQEVAVAEDVIVNQDIGSPERDLIMGDILNKLRESVFQIMLAKREQELKRAEEEALAR